MSTTTAILSKPASSRGETFIAVRWAFWIEVLVYFGLVGLFVGWNYSNIAWGVYGFISLLPQLIMSAIEGLKEDYKEAFEKLETSTAAALAAISTKVDDFINGHSGACFFLTWRKGRWRSITRVGVVVGILAALPPFVLGVAEILKLLVK